MFPAKQPSRVVVRTRDGRSYSAYLEYPKGDPREPMTMHDLEVKFKGNSAALLAPERQTAVRDAIFACEKLSCRDLMAKLVV